MLIRQPGTEKRNRVKPDLLSWGFSGSGRRDRGRVEGAFGPEASRREASERRTSRPERASPGGDGPTAAPATRQGFPGRRVPRRVRWPIVPLSSIDPRGGDAKMTRNSRYSSSRTGPPPAVLRGFEPIPRVPVDRRAGRAAPKHPKIAEFSGNGRRCDKKSWTILDDGGRSRFLRRDARVVRPILKGVILLMLTIESV